MSYPKNPELYPAEYATIYRNALAAPVEIDAGDEKKAKHLRHRLHAYRRAVETAKSRGWTELRKIVIRVEGSKLILDKEPSFLDHAPPVASVSDEELDKYLRESEEGEDNGN